MLMTLMRRALELLLESSDTSESEEELGPRGGKLVRAGGWGRKPRMGVPTASINVINIVHALPPEANRFFNRATRVSRIKESKGRFLRYNSPVCNSKTSSINCSSGELQSRF